MRELAQILLAFEQITCESQSAALATVIAVGGSSYRRPGARMLIGPDGRTWGGISGGCLERDVARRGLGVLSTGQAMLCRYDTTESPDDQTEGDTLLDLGRTPGVTLGCRGVIDLFIERVSLDASGPFPLIARALRDRTTVQSATLLRSSGTISVPTGTRFERGTVLGIHDSPDSLDLIRSIEDRMTCTSESKYGRVRHIKLDENRSADLFLETFRPPQSLVIFGGGSDVVPLMELAKTLGWHVTVVASSGSGRAAERFAAADVLRVGDKDDPSTGLAPEPEAAVVLMTHDYPRDVQILRALSGRPIRYLGMLGPRSRSERLLAHAGKAENWNAFFPAGLDLGADHPELIALAIISEIQAVLANRPAGPLRDRPGPIYPRAGGLS